MKRARAATDKASSETTLLPTALGEIAQWVVFSLDTNRYALPLIVVERVVLAAEVTPLPQAPPTVLGVINLEGRILPVFNVRRKFRLPERAIDPADQFLIANAGKRTVVLVIDSAHGVLERPVTATIDAGSIMPNLGHIRGAISLEDGLILIHDLALFLSPDESGALDEAMNHDASNAG